MGEGNGAKWTGQQLGLCSCPPVCPNPAPSSVLSPQVEDEPEAAADGDEEGGDGFFVDDGYLSEDEGMRDSQQEAAEEGEWLG